MTRRPARVTQGDLTKALAAAQAAGLAVTRTEITADGRIVLHHDAPVPEPSKGKGNTCDAVFN